MFRVDWTTDGFKKIGVPRNTIAVFKQSLKIAVHASAKSTYAAGSCLYGGFVRPCQHPRVVYPRG